MNNDFDQNIENLENSQVGNLNNPLDGVISENISPDNNKKSNKKVIIGLVISLIVILLFVALGVYKFYYNNPYNILVRAVDNLNSGISGCMMILNLNMIFTRTL